MHSYEFRLASRAKCFSKCDVPVPIDTCTAVLPELYVGANRSATPTTWNFMQFYYVQASRASAGNFTDYTAEFLLTRGPYAVIGYSWIGCATTNEPSEKFAP